MLDTARFAPSGGNKQGWHVIVVRDQALRAELKKLYLRSWQPLYEARLAQNGTADAVGRRELGIDKGNFYAEHLDDLPVQLVVLCGCPSADIGRHRPLSRAKRRGYRLCMII